MQSLLLLAMLFVVADVGLGVVIVLGVSGAVVVVVANVIAVVVVFVVVVVVSVTVVFVCKRHQRLSTSAVLLLSRRPCHQIPGRNRGQAESPLRQGASGGAMHPISRRARCHHGQARRRGRRCRRQRWKRARTRPQHAAQRDGRRCYLGSSIERRRRRDGRKGGWRVSPGCHEPQGCSRRGSA